MPDCQQRCGVWALGQVIGRGASGVVYLATGPGGETAAVKVCRAADLGSERYERELRGAKLYQSIRTGEGLVRMFELGEFEGGFYTVMELADEEFEARPGETSEYRSKTLARVIAGEMALSLEESLKLGIELAKGLVALQRRHLLHRDVKPGNVVFVRGRPVLADPGLLVEEAEAASLVGTPGYVPPENFTAAGGDVYSLGLTLKAASFGRPVDELGKGPSLEADTGGPFFPAWWRILSKATHPDAKCRYRSAKGLLKDLRSLRRRMAMSTTTLGVTHRGWFGILVLAGMILLVLGKLKMEYGKHMDKSLNGVKTTAANVIRDVEGTSKDVVKTIQRQVDAVEKLKFQREREHLKK